MRCNNRDHARDRRGAGLGAAGWERIASLQTNRSLTAATTIMSPEKAIKNQVTTPVYQKSALIMENPRQAGTEWFSMHLESSGCCSILLTPVQI